MDVMFMFRLTKITKVRNQAICFCGRPLTGEFCEIHGTDIRVDSVFVEATFQVTDDTGKPWNPLCDYHIHVSLPQNQFLRLFRTQKKFGRVVWGELTYEIQIPVSCTKDSTSELITDFLEQLELDTFGGYICLRSTQVRRSGATVYYLCKHRSTTDTIQLHFSIIALKRLSSYISWRLNQCQGDRTHITHSLKTTRSMVVLSSGAPHKIIDLQWDENKKLPSKIIVQDLEDLNRTSTELPTRLYQTQDHFFLGQRTEHLVLAGLETISQQFIRAFQQYLTTQSLTGHVKKVTSPEEKYNEYLGEVIAPSSHFLQAVGRLQNQTLSQKGYLSILTSSDQIQQPKGLLIVACSATKSSQAGTIPALLRYKGGTFLLLKSFLLEELWPPHIDLLIISAKFGLLKPLDLIPFYDHPLTPETVSTTERVVQEQLKTFDLDNYRECFLNLPEPYLPTLKSLDPILQDMNCRIIRSQGTQTARNIQMLHWLCHQVNEVCVLESKKNQ